MTHTLIPMTHILKFSWEFPLPHPGCICLQDTVDIANIPRGDPQPGAHPTSRAVGGGDKGIGTWGEGKNQISVPQYITVY